MPPVTHYPHLEEIVSRLAQGLQAEQIYLFGSQATKQDAFTFAQISYQFILAKLPDRIANSLF